MADALSTAISQVERDQVFKDHTYGNGEGCISEGVDDEVGTGRSVH
jgi:hypothetical protein